jgi:flagellar biosynthesis protein FlhF
MKIRRYTCNDMQEALLKVKMELGSEAVIMSSRKVKKKGLFGLFSKPQIEVVAAIDDDYVKPARTTQARSSLLNENAQPLYREPRQAYAQPQASTVSPNTAYVSAQMAYRQNMTQESPAGAYQAQPQGQEPQMQPQTQQPQAQPSQTVTQPQQQAQAMNPSPAEASSGDNQKIVELESKVKNMESMLEQIYRTVSDQKEVKASSEPESAASAAQDADEGDALGALRAALHDQELDTRLIDKIVEKVREKGGNLLKTEEMFSLAARVMQVLLGEPDIIKTKDDGKPQVVVFIGPTGVGKTTTLAKIAADFTLNKQKKVGLITADTYRIAAVEQLKTYAEILNIPVSVVYSPNEIRDAIGKLSDKDLILIDTAGRSHKNKSHFDELKTLVNAISADETYLVMSANTSRSAAREILEYYSFIKNYKLLFTKLDETPVPGIIVNARYLTGRPISYTTAGQSVPDDLDVANPKAIVSSFLSQKRTSD